MKVEVDLIPKNLIYFNEKHSKNSYLVVLFLKHNHHEYTQSKVPDF